MLRRARIQGRIFHQACTALWRWLHLTFQHECGGNNDRTFDSKNLLIRIHQCFQRSVADEPEPGLTTVTFAKSVPMSTYLACFIVSDFVAVTAPAKGLSGQTFPVSVYTTRAQQAKGSFALEIGVKAIEYYINLFNIDFPLPKLGACSIG